MQKPMALTNFAVDSKKNCLDIIMDTAGSLIIKIVSVHGRIIKTIRELHEEDGIVSVNLADISSGNYVANVFKDNSFLHSIRFDKN